MKAPYDRTQLIAASPEGPLRPVPVRKDPRATNRTSILWIAFLIVLVTAGVLAGFIPRYLKRAAVREETRELAIPAVIVVSPTPGKTSVAPALPAEVKAYAESPIYARASGFLKRWHVDIGARVEAGQLLAEIDTPELNQELARSRAELKQSEAALDLAKITSARWAELVKTKSVSEQEAAEKQSDLTLKIATVDAARATVRRLEELQSFSRVTAPFAGTITARTTDTGQLIRADSGRELFRLAQTEKLRVYVRVPQAAARVVKAGQTAELTIPELPERVFAAKIVRNSGAMSADSRTLLTELEVDNPNGEILAGSFAQVRLTDSIPEAVLTVPSNTLLFRSDGPQLAVIGTNDTIELRLIKIGRDFGPTVEILAGATTSDRLVLNPPDSIVTGMKVRIIDRGKERVEK